MIVIPMSSSEYHHFVMMMTMIIAYIFHNDFTSPFILPLLFPNAMVVPYTHIYKSDYNTVIITHVVTLHFSFVRLHNHCCAFILQARKPMGAISSSYKVLQAVPDLNFNPGPPSTVFHSYDIQKKKQKSDPLAIVSENICICFGRLKGLRYQAVKMMMMIMMRGFLHGENYTFFFFVHHRQQKNKKKKQN